MYTSLKHVYRSVVVQVCVYVRISILVLICMFICAGLCVFLNLFERSAFHIAVTSDLSAPSHLSRGSR